MAGATREHNLVTGNTFRSLGNQLENRDCEIYQSEMRVKVRTKGAYRYPDVVVVCETPEFMDTTPESLVNPTVIIEVLSDSTTNKDRGIKLQEYRLIPTLKEYLLISQDKPQVERFLRQDDINWLYTALDGIDNTIDLPSIGCTLKFSEIYRRVSFEPETDEA